jgi:hypothetical protein
MNDTDIDEIAVAKYLKEKMSPEDIKNKINKE